MCHRQAPVNSDGRFAYHGIHTGAYSKPMRQRGCSGEGRPGKDLAAKLARDRQTQAVVLALAQCVLAFDMHDGLYMEGRPVTQAEVLDDASLNEGRTTLRVSHGYHLTPKSDLGMIEGARAALFDICQDHPELLEGTSLTIQQLQPAAEHAGLIAGPCACAELAQGNPIELQGHPDGQRLHPWSGVKCILQQPGEAND